jgi:hypothetical protein
MAAKKTSAKRKTSGSSVKARTGTSTRAKKSTTKAAGRSDGRRAASGKEAVKAIRSTDPELPPERGRSARAKTTRVSNPKRSTTTQASKRTRARGVDGRNAGA